jgi:hypothetical protein
MQCWSSTRCLQRKKLSSFDSGKKNLKSWTWRLNLRMRNLGMSKGISSLSGFVLHIHNSFTYTCLFFHSFSFPHHTCSFFQHHSTRLLCFYVAPCHHMPLFPFIMHVYAPLLCTGFEYNSMHMDIRITIVLYSKPNK